jgi:hypothetical protein
MRHRLSVAALVAATCCSTPILAQSAQRWSLQVSGLYVGVFGNAYSGLDNGFGGEVQARVTPSLWSYGFGAQFSSHGLSRTSGNSIGLSGVFFEPRRVFDIGSAKYAPYVSGRLAYLQQAATLQVGQARVSRPTELPLNLTVRAASGIELSASGFQGNVGGGVLTKLSPRVNLDLGLTLGLIRFGDVTVKNNGQNVGKYSGTSGTGQNAVVRAGLAIGLGGGAKKAVAPAPKAAPRPARK